MNPKTTEEYFLFNVRSLGYASDLLLLSFEGNVIDHGDVIQTITEDNQDYYWGNFLVFPHPPKEGDHKRWLTRFKELFSDYPGVRHVALGWDGIDGEVGCVEPFTQDDFILERLAVMTVNADTLKRPKSWHEQVIVKTLDSTEEWEAATQLQLTRNEDIPDEEFEPFKREQMKWYRRLSEKGYGHWYGAWLDGQIVGDLGIFFGDTFGRFQAVETHPDFRRRGIASTLVYQASQHAFSLHPEHTLVIVADDDSPAMRMYEGVGYQVTERKIETFKRP